ncbi:hypothetical protein D9757_002220 [Collybiopsis confluens]|uniref:Uncharacterized protein n=1 Tax=Collybiopsis confluens TaxID=2823264 RepID=A0A8H5MG52_9AGAR|nr:hypothetical protein D9757_002220 [Collybiopsis confluens]
MSLSERLKSRQNQAHLVEFLSFADDSSDLETEHRECLEALRLLSLASAQLSCSSDLEKYSQYIALHAKYRTMLERGFIAWTNTWLFELQTESTASLSMLEHFQSPSAGCPSRALLRYRSVLEIKDFQITGVCAPNNPGPVVAEHLPLEPRDLRRISRDGVLEEQVRMKKVAETEPHDDGQSGNASVETLTASHPETLLLYHHHLAGASVTCEPPFPYLGPASDVGCIPRLPVVLLLDMPVRLDSVSNENKRTQ